MYISGCIATLMVWIFLSNVSWTYMRICSKVKRRDMHELFEMEAENVIRDERQAINLASLAATDCIGTGLRLERKYVYIRGRVSGSKNIPRGISGWPKDYPGPKPIYAAPSFGLVSGYHYSHFGKFTAIWSQLIRKLPDKQKILPIEMAILL